MSFLGSFQRLNAFNQIILVFEDATKDVPQLVQPFVNGLNGEILWRKVVR